MARALLIFLLCFSITVSAQNKSGQATPSYSPEQCTVGFYSRDSIAIKTKDGKPHYDMIALSNKKLEAIRAQQIIVNDQWLTVKDDSVLSSTAAGRKKQEAALKAVLNLQADSLIEIMQIRMEYDAMKLLYSRIDFVADSIGEKRGVKQVMDLSQNSNMICPTDQMLKIDSMNDIALALQLKPKLLRVGTYNGDSLLRTMPGYAILADSTKTELEQLNKTLAVMDFEINRLQHELDSLRQSLSNKKIKTREKVIAEKQEERDIFRGYEFYKLDVRDSIRTSVYRKKLRIAVAGAAKAQTCTKYYEFEVAYLYWSANEAEFIDLNKTIAEKLK